MNQQNITVDIFHNGSLLSSQPWVYDNGLYYSSDELYGFFEGFNDEINQGNADIWGELHCSAVIAIQEDILKGKKSGSTCISSDYYEATVTWIIHTSE